MYVTTNTICISTLKSYPDLLHTILGADWLSSIPFNLVLLYSADGLKLKVFF